MFDGQADVFMITETIAFLSDLLVNLDGKFDRNGLGTISLTFNIIPMFLSRSGCMFKQRIRMWPEENALTGYECYAAWQFGTLDCFIVQTGLIREEQNN
jgi:hypothetical protein